MPVQGEAYMKRSCYKSLLGGGERKVNCWPKGDEKQPFTASTFVTDADRLDQPSWISFW